MKGMRSGRLFFIWLMFTSLFPVKSTYRFVKITCVASLMATSVRVVYVEGLTPPEVNFDEILAVLIL